MVLLRLGVTAAEPLQLSKVLKLFLHDLQQGRKMLGHSNPDTALRDVLVIVAVNVSRARYVHPRNRGIPLF